MPFIYLLWLENMINAPSLAVPEADADALAAICVEAMRESLENIGRCDPERARNRFLSGFEPTYIKGIHVSDYHVGFFVVRPIANGLYLDHLYVRPSHQSQGVGAAVLQRIFAQADERQCEVVSPTFDV